MSEKAWRILRRLYAVIRTMCASGIPWNQPTAVGAEFCTTSWSAILTAAQGSDPAQALSAWERLCRTYWKPIYAYIRRQGNSPELAKDLTQDFFYHLLRRERLRHADRRKGRFRSFLLTALNRFLHSEWDRRIAQKRDERIVVSLDEVEVQGPLRDPGGLSPAELFELEWAHSLLAGVRGQLAAELQGAGKRAALSLLPAALYEDDSFSYAEWGRRLEMTEDNVKKTVQRLRERWQRLLREQVLATVDTASEVDEELRYLSDLAARFRQSGTICHLCPGPP